jgi:hypothetical protein
VENATDLGMLHSHPLFPADLSTLELTASRSTRCSFLYVVFAGLHVDARVVGKAANRFAGSLVDCFGSGRK